MSSEKIKNFSYILFFFGRGPFLSAYLIVFLPLVLDLMKYNSNINGNVHFLFFPMAPASALVITNGLTCLSVILLSPAIGGISDYGDYRRKFIFYFLGIFVSFMSLPFFLVTYQSWLLAAFILVVAFTAFECCYALITSYLSEISNNKEERSFLSSFSVISENLSIICILIAMPIFLIGEKPRNLITNGNFEVPDSFQSWQIESGGSIQKCERRYDFLDVLKFSSAKCWRGENNVKQAKADLEIFVPKNKEITLFQQKKIYYPFNGDFRLTLKSSTKKLRQFVKTTLSILQKDKNNKNLLEKTSLVFQVTSKDQFISTKFDVLEATRLLEFRITMKSVDDVSSIMKVSNIETILSINKVHIWILFLCAVWFTVITFVCVLLLGKFFKKIKEKKKKFLTLRLEIKEFLCLDSLCYEKLFSILLKIKIFSTT
ncbi:hypothetical protein MHBO_001387 [Bonamia ostreae]|uniref:Uncharacterized protein n=1 Tax=Bonamia ostreae TaxID=126728 RepID=A0ABV2AIS2_9EUKA